MDVVEQRHRSKSSAGGVEEGPAAGPSAATLVRTHEIGVVSSSEAASRKGRVSAFVAEPETEQGRRMDARRSSSEAPLDDPGALTMTCWRRRRSAAPREQGADTGGARASEWADHGVPRRRRRASGPIPSWPSRPKGAKKPAPAPSGDVAGARALARSRRRTRSSARPRRRSTETGSSD